MPRPGTQKWFGARKRSKKQRLKGSAPSRVFELSEVLLEIFLSLPPKALQTCSQVSQIFRRAVQDVHFNMKYYNVPSTETAACSKFEWCDEIIAQFIEKHAPQNGTFEWSLDRYESFYSSKILDRYQTCFDGWRAEEYVSDRTLLRTSDCYSPCLVDDCSIASANLGAGPVKRLVSTLLTVAWTMVRDSRHAEPMHPLTFTMTCDGELVMNTVYWVKFDEDDIRMTSKFATHLPRNTFEQMINVAFQKLNSYTTNRIDRHRGQKTFSTMLRSGVLCPDCIWKAFKLARSASWSLEQVLWIVDRIPVVRDSACQDCGKSFRP